MKIYHISDTHGSHKSLTIPDVDVLVFSGDCSNPRDPYTSHQEVLNFINWFEDQPTKYKIFVAGNHDIAIERRLIDMRSYNFTYLENESVEIEGLKFWGSPISPSFGVGWGFNKSRDKMYQLWDTIPKDTDCIITHGPPKGILDLNSNVESCGCSALAKTVDKIRPQLVMFGHIHDNDKVKNSGLLLRDSIIYSNGSVVNDRLELVNSGNLIELR